MTDSNQPPQSKIDSIIALFSNNKLQEALDKVKTLSNSFPKDSLLHNITGACYAGLGQLGSAVKSYEKAIEIKPDYAKAHYNLGNALHDLALQGLGYLDDPINSYERSLEIDPDYAEAHNNLGNVLKDLGRLDEAFESFEKALTIKPDYVEAHYSLGIVLFDLGQLDDAVKSYKKTIEINPGFAQAHNSLGNAFTEQGQLDDAIQSYQKALKLNPNYSEAHNNLGNSLTEQGQFNDAIVSYQKALEINPNYPALHNNLGNAFKELGQLEDALKSYSKGLTYNPNYIDLLNNLGVVLNDLGQLDEAVKSYERAIDIKPDYAEAYNNLGVTYNKLGQLEKAVQVYEKALKIDPDYADTHNNLGVVLKKLGQLDEAIDSYQKAIAINPDDADTYNNLGIVFDEQERLDDAIQSYRKAVSIQPDLAEAYNNLGHTLCKLHRYQEAIDLYEKVFDIKPNLDYILGNILNTKMNSCNWDDLEELLTDAKQRIVNNEKIIEPFNLMGLVDDPALQIKAQKLRMTGDHPKSNILPTIGRYPKHPKIRIGYFSADFREHPVGYLTAELYELHDRNYFEVHAFSFGSDTKDALNLRIKAGVDQFHNVQSMSHKEMALFVRSLEIDIAVDLGGFTQDARTDVFAMSAAPIQLSYIGYLGTMGADYYDYLIADPVMIPKENQKYYVEKIVYLPSFQVNDSKDLPPEITLTRKDVGLPEEGFVFCCFNNTYKFTPTIFDSWARILSAVDNSVLIVFANNELSKTNLTKELIQRGVKAERLIFGDSVKRPEYLARYRTADLFLDTHPYNAGTTASDALKMGLPLLTMIGKSFNSREAASILTSINLPELITNTPEEYEALAIELASNPDKLKAIKDKLTSNLSTAPLYDTKLFTKNIESAYTEMYERHHKGLEPDHIYVEE
jgi:predicted O-linked N-acetylglucosamine transferase (SPINDLY family)